MNKLMIIVIISMSVSWHSLASSTVDLTEKQAISAQAKAFSKAFVDGDVETLMAIYSPNAHIVDGNQNIESDINAIRKLWTPKPDRNWRLIWHKTESKELIVEGTMASDIGYYSGLSRSNDGKEFPFKGAYVIVWLKIDGVWRMHIDMWNSIKE